MSRVKVSDVFSFSNLEQIYEKYIKDSRVTGLDNIQPSRLVIAEQIGCLKKFNSQKYKFTNYKEQLFSKGRSKSPRCVSIATARDRVILKALQKYLSLVLPEFVTPHPQEVIGQIQKCLILDESTHFIRTDISSFYDNINHDKLILQLSKKIKSKKILALIQNAISTPTTSQRQSKLAPKNAIGVPQGLSISNILAEIYLSSLDKKMKEDSQISYYRYVDDILILCSKNDINRVEKLLKEKHKELDLECHSIQENGAGKSVKGSLSDNNVDYLGYCIKNKTMRVRQDSIVRFEAQIAKLFTEAKYRLARARNPKKDKEKIIKLLEWKINLRITGCIFNNQRRGWVFYFSQIQDTSQLKTLDSIIAKFCIRFNFQNLNIKSLHKAFFETKRSLTSQKYIPNFDMFNTDQKREFLALYLFNVKIELMTDQDIENRFKRSIKDNIKDLERDLKDFS